MTAMTHTNNSAELWYRNPWVWLLIAIPSLTIAGCMLTIFLALTNPHILVGNEPATGHATGIAESGHR